MLVYSFDVALSSHDYLKLGVTEKVWIRVVVSVDAEHPNPDDEAHKLAAWMAGNHGMVTNVLWRL
jgi:hypothetical protein